MGSPSGASHKVVAMAGPPPPTSSLPPADLTLIADRVEHRLRVLLDAERARWVDLDPSLGEPLDALRDLVLAGGKRIRPAFCHWGFVGAGGDPDDLAVVETGAAFEMLQGFALIHDDVLDGSAVRRGAATVHRRFIARHADAEWMGEQRRFGEGAAILIGDLALVYADLLLPAGIAALTELWNELRIELTLGQYLDLHGTASGRNERALARTIARYKSGKYSIERPLQVGIALGGRPDLVEPSSRYGDPLGEAFQLRDDVLGVFGDAARTGKPVGDDLREGKPTLLLAAARDQADEGQRRVLAQVGDPHLDAEAVAAIQTVLGDTGAVAEVEGRISDLATEATEALPLIGLADPAVRALHDLAEFVVARDA